MESSVASVEEAMSMKIWGIPSLFRQQALNLFLSFFINVFLWNEDDESYKICFPVFAMKLCNVIMGIMGI